VFIEHFITKKVGYFHARKSVISSYNY